MGALAQSKPVRITLDSAALEEKFTRLNQPCPPLLITSPENHQILHVTVHHTDLCFVYVCIVACRIYSLGCRLTEVHRFGVNPIVPG